MSSAQIIIILVAFAGIGAFGYLRSDKNEYTERGMDLKSQEAKDVEFIFKQLAKSTNYLVQCISPKVSPVAQQRLLRSAVVLNDSGKVALVGGHWSGEYLKVQIETETETDLNALHSFMLEAEVKGGFKLLGVQ